MRLWIHRLRRGLIASMARAAETDRGGSRDPELVEFGSRLRSLREAAGLTQEQLAHQAGLHWTYVGQIERGERNLTYKNVLRLARGLKVASRELLD